jgi:hypothetical protein
VRVGVGLGKDYDGVYREDYLRGYSRGYCLMD